VKRNFTSSDLPAWLEGVPTIAWLARGDAALALGLRASQATITETVSKDKTLVAPNIWRNRAAETRANLNLDDPREWDSFSLGWLCTHVGDERLVADCCDDLLSALKAGTVRAIHARTLTPITEAAWIAGTVGDPFPPLIYDRKREEWRPGSSVLFQRDDIVKLRQRRLGHPVSDGPNEVNPLPKLGSAELPLETAVVQRTMSLPSGKDEDGSSQTDHDPAAAYEWLVKEMRRRKLNDEPFDRDAMLIALSGEFPGMSKDDRLSAFKSIPKELGLRRERGRPRKAK
jgi:hypothetical protein